MENGGCLSGCKMIGGEVNHSLQTEAKVKKLRKYGITRQFPTCLRGVVRNLAQGQVGCYLLFRENFGTNLKRSPILCITCHPIFAQYLRLHHLSTSICTITATPSLVTIYLHNTRDSITCHLIFAQYLRLHHLSTCICTIPETPSLVNMYLHNT